MSFDFGKMEEMISKAGKEGRMSLSEAEVYETLSSMGLTVPVYKLFDPEKLPPSSDAAGIAGLFPGTRLVVKAVSPKILHKTETGCVKIIRKDELLPVLSEMASRFPEAEKLMVCEFVEHAVFSPGQELMLGARSDKAFGPLLTLGIGGTDAEAFTAALKTGHSPSIMPVEMLQESGGWEKFLSGAWIWRYPSGAARGGKRLVPDADMVKWMEAFSAAMVHFGGGGKTGWTIEEMEVNPLAVSDGRLVALDGVLRFRPSAPETRERPTAKGVWSLLKPSTVAVAGVSEKKMNMGRIILNNVLAAGFERSKVFILKDHACEIDGARCYPSACAFPEPVDMLVVAVPSPEVPGVIEDAGRSGRVRGVVLISGGMGEKSGSETAGARVVEAVEAAKKINPDFSLSGGNSLGIVSVPARVNTLFIPDYKLDYPVRTNPLIAGTAFISQSGAFVISALSKMPWLKPLYSVSVGNQQDVTVADYVEQVALDPAVKVILAYMEGFKNSDGLILARTIAKARKEGKQVVVYKAGRTPTGQKAVMGHTASIAGDFVVARSVLGAAGAMVAETFDDFSDMACAACHFAGLAGKGGKTFFMSNAGFETAGMADNIHPGSAISAPAPSPELSAELEVILKESALDSIVDVRNPLDLTPMAGDNAIMKVVKAVIASDETDAVVLSMVPLTPAMQTLPPGPGHREDLSKSFLSEAAKAARETGKPLIFCVAAGSLYNPYCDHARKFGIPVFRSADRAVQIFAKYLEAAGR
ncbi:MAG: acetate--CoA ligase family protein [bacterium]